MKVIGHITLSDALDSGNPDRCFIHQTLVIRAETRTSRFGLDGKLSIARCPRNVTWYGGSLDFLAGVSRIRIVADGRLLMDEALDTRQQPQPIPGGVSFDVAVLAPWTNDALHCKDTVTIDR
jgi:hypothetical protein